MVRILHAPADGTGPRKFAVIVRAAGHDMTDVGWLTWFVTDNAEYLAYKRVVGNAYNVRSVPFSCDVSLVIVNDFIEDEALVEIQATAYIAQN